MTAAAGPVRGGELRGPFRAVLLTGLVAAVAIAATVTWHGGLHAGAADYGPSRAAAMVAFLVGWALMSVAMMLPTALPLVALVARAGGAWSALAAALAYLAVWASIGPGIWFANHALAGWWGPETPQAGLLMSTALIIAGAYQLSPLARRCLNACRHPFGFLARHWGTTGVRLLDAARVGAAYGLSCLGCCAALMGVMVIAGLTDLASMLALGIVMAIQKHAPYGQHLLRPVGITLLAAGVAVAGSAMGPQAIAPARIDWSVCAADRTP